MQHKQPMRLPFTKGNYQLLSLGIFFLSVGYTMMAFDKKPYGFGSLGLTVGPIVVLLGYIIEFFAILYVPNKHQQQKASL